MVQTAPMDYSLSVLRSDEALGNESVQSAWTHLLDVVHPLNRMLSSPTMYELRCQIAEAAENCVFVIRDDDRIVGVCPIVQWRITMPFQIQKHVLGSFKLNAATVLSGEPMLPADSGFLGTLFESLLKELAWCDCIYFPSLPADTDTCRFLYSQAQKSQAYFVHPHRLHPREWLYLELGKSLDDFLHGKHKRTRNTLKRRVRKLRDHGGGQLTCERVETGEQVDAFYESARLVAEQSWQFHSFGGCLEETALYLENLRNLARLGSLRAYLLKCGGRPCAFVIGYQYDDVLQFQQTAYAADFARFSPGTVLYYMLLEDLYTHRRPKLVNHGVGVTPHKRLFTNRHALDTTVYLFRPTVANRLKSLTQGMFSKGLDVAKHLFKRDSAGADHCQDTDEDRVS